MAHTQIHVSRLFNLSDGDIFERVVVQKFVGHEYVLLLA